MKGDKYKVLHVLHANYAYKNKTLSSQFSTWKGRYAYDEIWDLFSLYLNTSSCRTYYFIDIKIKLADFFSRVNGSFLDWYWGLLVFTACTTTSDCKNSNYTVSWNPFEFVICENPIWRTCTAGYCVCDKTLVTYSYT